MGGKRYEPKRRKNIGIGLALSKMRVEAGYMQPDVEEAIGMTRQHISTLENDRGNPPLLTLAALTELYGGEVADLFCPARIHKEYPNKQHEELHAKIQSYIEKGLEEFTNIERFVDLYVDVSS